MEPVSERHGYRNVEYTIAKFAGPLWGWAFRPKIGERAAARGEVPGTYKDAVDACKKAIDQWLDRKDSAQKTLAAGQLQPD